ncbi:ABC transporter ATP-binding protein [Paenibacillus glycanilyticus]|uniref:Lipid A ABC transporter permease/ATP-binding protein n=1 Tax=Paenibacillus glycanilyticus TaxID=126569 RepID=A0ABQ6GCE1_9BACL|nr:ABC transporter ATP-binding protein [Paenibacillus glycanilyticus]GLX68190.1 lipid A ABC transporter permease/ATP-binding protein [Paenibacillus glycanilyticus]
MPTAINNWQMDQKGSQGGKQPKPEYKSAFRILKSYINPHRKTFSLVAICTIIAIVSDLFQPYLVKIAIDDNLMVGKNDYSSLIIICAIYLGLSVSGLFFTYLQNNLLQDAGQSIVARIRKQLFEHITKLSMSYFDKTSSGSLITHVSSDTEAVNQFFNQVLLTLLRDGLTLVSILVMMFYLDTTLGFYCLLLLPIIALIAIGFRSFMRTTYQMARTRLSRLVAFVAENLAGMSLIQVFHQQKAQGELYKERNEDYFKANVREIRTAVTFNRTFDLLGNLTIAFVVWTGGKAVLGDTMEFGVLYAFITYIRQFFQPINAITQQWNTLQSATVAVNRIWGVLDTKPEIQEPEKPITVDQEAVQGRVDYNDISFSYGNGTPIFRGLDLHIHAGEMIGIVGTTGAGKSSLMSLLCRFYDVQQGSIQIDGQDVRDIPQPVLHRMVGLVQQEPYLYAGSIIDNVRMFDESISREDVIRACEFVGADQLVNRMADGYETKLSERGSGLSAGERQLISFARIIVFRPKILILDEATANLDSQTEQLIQRALQVVSEGRTTIVIAHRLSTIMQADRIIVLSHGTIVESGTHAELVEQQGVYEELYRHSQGEAAATLEVTPEAHPVK